jgi:hypothetical protein
MQTKCEIVGWLHVDDDKTQMLVREEDGRICRHTAAAESEFGQRAIQTGAFRRLHPVFDAATNELLGYDMECLPPRLAAIA